MGVERRSSGTSSPDLPGEMNQGELARQMPGRNRERSMGDAGMDGLPWRVIKSLKGKVVCNYST